jgi:hypothetical protein
LGGYNGMAPSPVPPCGRDDAYPAVTVNQLRRRTESPVTRPDLAVE